MRNTNFLAAPLFAHRGLFDKEKGIPENSLMAFQRAIDKGYSIELDVHLLKDNTIVVFHDDTLKRMTGVTKKIRECTYAEIKELSLENTSATIPLLEEVLSLVARQCPLLIELKSDQRVGKLEEKLVRILQNYSGKYAIESFNPLSVLWFKRNAPEITRGQISSGFNNNQMRLWQTILLNAIPLHFLTHPDFIAYDMEDLPNRKIQDLRKTKLILGWTVKSKKEYIKIHPFCDNVIAENLDNW